MARIPKAVKEAVWKKYMGNKREGKCYCCRKTIDFFDFDVGHNSARSKGGPNQVENLRSICRSCNLSMGTKTTEKFRADHFTPNKGKQPKSPSNAIDEFDKWLLG